MIRVKAGRPLVTWIVKSLRLMEGRLSNGTVRVTIVFLMTCHRLQKRSSLKFLVIYLKAQNVNLMQALAGTSSKDMTNLGCRVSRNGKHLPRIIPILHRKWIRQGSTYHVKLWVTLFNLYRVLSFPGILKLSTILDPSTSDQTQYGLYSRFALIFWRLVREITNNRWLKLCHKDKLEALKELRVRPFGIATSSPAMVRMISSSYLGILGAILLWKNHPSLPSLLDYLRMTGNQSFIRFLELGFGIKDWPSELLQLVNKRGSLGGLGLKPEPAGKVRVFALVDCITQWVLDPLHKRLFSILRNIPQDGTFDQIKPLERLLRSNKPLYSLDLSAATDRLPIVVQMIVLSPLVGSHFANLWSHLLIGRSYKLPKSHLDFLPSGTKLETVSLIYGAGQPMGALTSWAMLAVTHHFIVQLAAYLVRGKEEWFTDYAVLGDDVVIANGPIAHKYLYIMNAMGVNVGIHKSLLSPSGSSLEFAKRYYYKKVDCSAIPLKEVYAGTISVSATVELMRKYKRTIAQILAFNHFGYKALSRIPTSFNKMSSRMRAIVLSSLIPRTLTVSNLSEFLSKTSLFKSREVPNTLSQSITDSFISLIQKSLIKLGVDAYDLGLSTAPDQNKVKWIITNPDPDMIYHDSVSTGPLPESYVNKHRTGSGLAFPYGSSPSGPRTMGGSATMLGLLKYLVAVDRTRAHYGTTSFDQDIRITRLVAFNYPGAFDFSKMPVSNELYSYLVTINEFVYREQYLKTIQTVKDIVAQLESIQTLSKEDSISNLLILLIKLEEEMSLLSFVDKNQMRVVAEMKSSVSRYLRLWKSVNLGIKLK